MIYQQPIRPLKEVLRDLLRQHSIILYENGFKMGQDFFIFYEELSRQGYADVSIGELCDTLKEVSREQIY